MKFLDKILKRDHRVFTPLEEQLLAELQARLPSVTQERLARQLQVVKRASRDREVREVYYYRPEPLRSDPTLQFPIKSPELKFAIIRFQCRGVPGSWKASFILTNRYFSWIVFSPGTKPIQNCTDLKIEQVEVLHDPMKETLAFTLEPPLDRSALSGWLVEWLKEHPVENIAPPLSQEERQWFLGNVEATLPSDYLELTEQCEGFSLGDCTVIGLSGLYEIHLPEGDYYILAERGGGVLAVRSTRRDGIIYYLYHEDSKAVELGLSFRQAVEWLLQRPELP